jgi:integrase
MTNPFTKRQLHKNERGIFVLDTALRIDGVKHRVSRVLDEVTIKGAVPKAKAIIAGIKAGRFAAFAGTNSRAGFASIGDVAAAYVAGDTFDMSRKLRLANLSALRWIVRTGLGKPNLTANKIDKMAASILTGELVGAFKRNAKAQWVPRVYAYEERTEAPRAGDLKGKDKARVWGRINACLRKGRCVFTKDRLHKTEGCFVGLTLPDLSEFVAAKGVKANAASVAYVPPDDREISRILADLPALRAGEYSATYCVDNHTRRVKPRRVYVALILALAGGLRATELGEARWSMLSMSGGKFYLKVGASETYDGTKGGEDRVVVLPESVVEEMRAVRNILGEETAGDFLIGGSDYYRRRLMPREVATVMRRAGWKRSQCLHELRKIWASDLGEDGADVLTVMQAGGWKDWHTAQRYIAKNKLPTYSTGRRLGNLVGDRKVVAAA